MNQPLDILDFCLNQFSSKITMENIDSWQVQRTLDLKIIQIGSANYIIIQLNCFYNTSFFCKMKEDEFISHICINLELFASNMKSNCFQEGLFPHCCPLHSDNPLPQLFREKVVQRMHSGYNKTVKKFQIISNCYLMLTSYKKEINTNIPLPRRDKLLKTNRNYYRNFK